jgi:hypothetical protein
VITLGPAWCAVLATRCTTGRGGMRARLPIGLQIVPFERDGQGSTIAPWVAAWIFAVQA